MDPSSDKSRETGTWAKILDRETNDLSAVPLGRDSDEELMRQAQRAEPGGGNSQAFALLYERYSGSVLSYLYRMRGDIEDTEAIAQEVFLRAYRYRDAYRYPQNFSTWLFAIARYLAINTPARPKRDQASDVLQIAANATVDPQKRENIACMFLALDNLPADQKEVIVMGIFHDMSYGEMEQITGIDAVTLRSRMFHGLKKLSSRLSGDYQ
jgi:RNA polymerase sigma-70 factor (ECF subfamily)